MLCALFPSVPFLALTATACKEDRDTIKKTLHMTNPFEVVGSPNRVNIFYEKVFRVGPDIDAYENILKPIAENLLVQKYRLFERILRSEQYYPQDAHPIPENRLFSQFH